MLGFGLAQWELSCVGWSFMVHNLWMVRGRGSQSLKNAGLLWKGMKPTCREKQLQAQSWGGRCFWFQLFLVSPLCLPAFPVTGSFNLYLAFTYSNWVLSHSVWVRISNPHFHKLHPKSCKWFLLVCLQFV